MAGFRIAFTGSSGYLTCNMDCEHEISDSILIGYNNYGGGDEEPVYARRSAIFNANMGAAAGYLMLAAIIVDVSEQIPTFADTLFWRSGYDVMLNQTGIETGNYHGYFGYCSGGNLYGAYNDADIPVFSDMDEFYEYISSSPSQTSGGGAGSGYIGNSLVSNKKMVGYNVPTSSAESTKTESVNDVSASAVSGKPKSGNGFARIKFLREADISNMTEWTPDGAFGWSVTYDSVTKENHITGQCSQFWEYYEFPLDVERNKNYTVSLQFKGTNYNYFALYDTLRVLDRWQDATQIQQQDGINYNYVIAESDTHFSNQSNYVDCSVTFNSGNRDKVWLYIGAGYVYTNTWMDLYFKNIAVVKNN